ncbi:MAG: enoyl-CoA hydratase [Robiginitomaculum sp.]|nr:MAG: enoyl-CoA hydratase [Robiginitomaculum sp.]
MKNLPQSDALDLELKNGWLTVWFNQPEIRNPLTTDRVHALVLLAKSLEDRRDIRGVTFRGRGGIFCAGADLKAFKESFAGDLETRRKTVTALSLSGGKMFQAINRLPQFTIMAIEGAAMAGGFGMACIGDMVIVEAGARFSLTETKIGLNPAQITPYVMARLGTRNGRRLMMSAASFKGKEAVTLGLADEVVEGDGEMDAAIIRVQATIRQCAPAAIAATKALLLSLPYLNEDEQMQAAADSFVDCMMSEEGHEGITSILSKRAPDWALAPLGESV